MGCLFCKIAAKELKTEILFDEDGVLAFNDIRPQAPTHILIIPNEHIPSIEGAGERHQPLLGKMILTAQQLARQKGLGHGYRLVFNVNAGGGQEVYHLHLHLLGGRQMTWPPG